MWILIFQRLSVEVLLDFLYFPLWWYTAGARQALLWCVDRLHDGNDHMSPGLWLKNMFVPMYGQTDWQGRFMSFFVRLMNVIARTIGLVIWSVVILCGFFVWIAIPLVVGFFFVVSLV